MTTSKGSKPLSSHYQDSGPQGPAVLLIHGVGMDQRVWLPQWQALSADYRLITYDTLGHGLSPLPPDPASLSDYVAQIDDLLDHLGITATHVVGHSMGALIAVEFGLCRPHRCLSVTALNAVFKRSETQRQAVQARARSLQEQGLQANIRSTLERWYGSPTPQSLQEAAQLSAQILAQVDPVGYARAYRLFAHSDSAHADRLAKLAMPALFMTGSLDQNSSPAMTEAMAALAPQGQSYILEHAHHMMPLTHSEQVNRHIADFLSTSQAALPRP